MLVFGYILCVTLKKLINYEAEYILQNKYTKLESVFQL